MNTPIKKNNRRYSCFSFVPTFAIAAQNQSKHNLVYNGNLLKI